MTTQAQLAQLHGAGYYEARILKRRQEAALPTKLSTDHVLVHAQRAKASRWNIWRVPFDWAAAVAIDGKTYHNIFFQQLDYVVKTAKQYGIKVILANFHFLASNYITRGGAGFPWHVVKTYAPAEKLTPLQYETAGSNGERFWSHFWANDIPGVNAWQDLTDFLKKVVATVDKYDNVIGYELLNEPHFWMADLTQFKQAGDFNTFVGSELRKVTNKAVIFHHDYQWGNGKYSTSGRLLLRPRITGEVIYEPHVYQPPVPSSEIHCGKKGWRGLSVLDMHDASVAKWNSQGLKTMKILGEFATQNNELPCIASMDEAEAQKLMDAYVSEGKKRGYALCYWQQGIAAAEGNTLCSQATGELTDYGKRYNKALAKYYP